MSRQQQELHDREKWNLEKMIDRYIVKMELNVKRGNALQRIIRQEKSNAKGKRNDCVEVPT